jgi:Ca2+-binding EF-hand superfamily protein
MAEISAQERTYFRKMFDLNDTDKNEAIRFSELRNLSKHLGVELSDELLLTSLRSIGVRAEKDAIDLTFEDFLRWLKRASASGDEFALLKAKITASGNRALNNDQIARLKEVFDHFDVDHSGSIDAEELGAVFQAMGQEMSSEELESMIAGVDDDGSGQIEFPEFIMLMCSNFAGTSFESEMRDAFEAADYAQSGRMNINDVRSLIVELTGGLIQGEELEQIVQSAEGLVEGGVGMDYMKWESLWEACREEN